jgi:hypothetical protein
MDKHKMKWFARWGGEWIARSAGMQGKEWDVKCSCGWQTNTGGAIESNIRWAVKMHKWEVENGFWEQVA